MNILRKQSNLPFSCKSNHKKDNSVVSFTHEQNIICSQTQLDEIAHEQTILWAVICRARGGPLTNEKKEKFPSNDIILLQSCTTINECRILSTLISLY